MNGLLVKLASITGWQDSPTAKSTMLQYKIIKYNTQINNINFAGGKGVHVKKIAPLFSVRNRQI
jgi:hypothetical protein